MEAFVIKIIGALITCVGGVVSAYGLKVEMDERDEDRRENDKRLVERLRDIEK